MSTKKTDFCGSFNATSRSQKYMYYKIIGFALR